MVMLEVAFPETAGVTEEGEKAQVVFFGSPLQLRVVAPAKPLIEVTVTVTDIGLPRLTEPLDDESASEKSEAPAHTATVTAGDVDAELFASPPYTAVTL